MLAISAMTALFTMPASAAVEAADPTQLIQADANNVTEIVKTKTGAARETAMRSLLRQNFDLPHMASAALGQHWLTASEPQKARLLSAVEASEARAYSDRLGHFPGATVKVGTATPRAPGVWLVDSRFTLPSGQSLKLDWEVRQGPRGMRISDVRVAGISMFVTKRADFEAYIQGHGGTVEPLIQVLEARASR
jgi:phospholipid transport system substrate-binding protein